MTSKNPAKILFIDDQDNWRELLKKALKNENIHISEASTVEDAKDLITNLTFDLIVFDVRLEDDEPHNVEGLGLLYFVKAHSPMTKTIVLTGYPESIRGETDADVLLFKVPEGTNFDKDMFRDKIKELLEL